ARRTLCVDTGRGRSCFGPMDAKDAGRWNPVEIYGGGIVAVFAAFEGIVILRAPDEGARRIPSGAVPRLMKLRSCTLPRMTFVHCSKRAQADRHRRIWER